MYISELEKSIFESLYDGVLIADKDCKVVYINNAYTRITKVRPEDIIGRSLDTVRKGSKLPEVIKSGRKLLGIRRKVDGIEYVVNIVPIIKNDKIIGGVSILNEINDIYKLVEELRKSNNTIMNLKKRVKQMENAKYTIEDIISSDAKSENTKELALKIAHKDINVLITGESGTGKELYAQSIHNASSRRNESFVPLNCAALDNNLFESELFGYEEGSFTGSKKGGKTGLIQEADGGTIFLDEISELDYKLQAKLLRFLQERCIRPVGGVMEIPVDVRVIAATNKNLETLVAEGKFRQDLYYRLSVATLNLYPLKERRGDILPLINNFLLHAQYKFNNKVEMSEEALELLLNYDWPGNVRELKNTVEFAAMMAAGGIIRSEDLPKKIQKEGLRKDIIPIRTLEEVVKQAEINEIKKALMKYGNSVEGKKKVAQALGISLASLYNKINKY
ncbi:sigma 54-interacting transcriptional regulator [Clostridium sp. SYSU_GA19001]|uniref:sigma-54 interaction domain-containing protein n=1 Tax=Clostridium caldaquaticum TaxID=2940653 RepID=UPI002076F4F0|nr:sigma 54-interacting transcriptional regulator [Clostridium caldaquaticum]MCM8711705.1 sigma 54-interacting transcriptional regulator [Clostridium caldaquaticum]